jgi:hypothetical protein
MTTTPKFVSTAAELDTYTGSILARASLASSTKLVLLVLTQYFPGLTVSQAELGLDCSLSPRVVRQHLFYAREKGWVRREKQTGEGTGYRAPDKYRLVVQECPG